MQIISSGNYQGIGKYNNDIINCVGNMCYVMDGASALFNDNIFFDTSDLYEYMQLLKNNVKDSNSIIESLRNGINDSNKHLSGIEKYQEYELPTYTIAAVKEYDDYFEIYLLCDCLISILYKDLTIENIIDDRFDKIKYECRKKIKKVDEMNLNDSEKINLKRPIWREYRKYANQENGYPVGSTNNKSVENGIVKKIKKDDIDKILICSDGLYSKIGIPNNANYFDKQYIESIIKGNYDDLSYYLIKS